MSAGWRRGRSWTSAGGWIIALIWSVGCSTTVGNSGPIREAETIEAVDPVDRAVTIETEGCGHASATSGTGVVIGDEQVLTVAHVVAGSSAIAVVMSDRRLEAEIEAYDPSRDLALLRVPGAAAVAPPYAQLSAGDIGTIVTTEPSGPMDFVVVRRAEIEIDIVRSAGAAKRQGYELEAETLVGHSGAGAFDQGGRLAGIVFAVGNSAERRTWVTASDEVEAFLSDESLTGRFVCDRAQSRLIGQEG